MPRSYSGLALGRLLQIITLILSHGPGKLTAEGIAASIGCSTRQFSRYRKAIVAGGIAIESDRRVGYKIDRDQIPFNVELTLNEALGLLMCRAAAAGGGMQPFEVSTESAFDKISRLLPSSVRSLIESPSIRHVGGSRRDYSLAPWGTILTACRLSETLEIDYYAITQDRQSHRLVDPYVIVWLGGYCHLIAYCHTRRDIRNFSLDGIRAISRTGQRFSPQVEFFLEKYLTNAGPNIGEPVQIEVIFDAETARYAKRRTWEFEHTLINMPDGRLQMRGTVRGLIDIRRELLGWGSHVEVVSPPELREEMRDEASKMSAIYAVD